MISKELLSEVVGLCCGVKSIRNSEVIYWFNCIDKIRESSINIYELAYICKEWALSKGYHILSGYDNTETPEAIINHIYSESGCCCDESFEAKTEVEAIFKACQYIMENKCGS